MFLLLFFRYRIVVLAEDETEAYNFVLLDRAAKRIIGKTATKLIADNIQVSTISYTSYLIKSKTTISKTIF